LILQRLDNVRCEMKFQAVQKNHLALIRELIEVAFCNLLSTVYIVSSADSVRAENKPYPFKPYFHSPLIVESRSSAD
jgi:hypothetical protein